MNTNEIGSQLGLIAVKNDPEQLWLIDMNASVLSPATKIFIGRDNFTEATEEAVERVYSEGLIPLIILDQNLGNKERGSDILLEVLIGKYGESGGILICGSTEITTQKRFYNKILKSEENKWVLSEANSVSDIELIESSYIEYMNLHGKEPNVEFRNR